MAVLIALFVVEPAIAALAPEVGRFGPFGGLPTAVSGIAPEDAGMGAEIDLLPAGVAVLGMLGWIAAAFAASAALLRRRDVA